MNLSETMGRLEKLGSKTYQQVWPRHGVKPPLFGVKYADLYKIQKKLQGDHKLALQLWKTGNHDARILATLICEPQKMTSRELDAWIGPADNHILNDAVSGVAAKSPHAKKKADAWRKVKSEWKAAAGWNVVASMAAPGGAPDSWLATRLGEIQKGIDKAPNRTRHSMNQALISIGGYRPELRKKALDVAKAIGAVNVDHGETSCKTPVAGPYIRNMAKRAAKKKAKKKR
jgi:3-methyladenine DNA glycosylase AlkD